MNADRPFVDPERRAIFPLMTLSPAVTARVRAKRFVLRFAAVYFALFLVADAVGAGWVQSAADFVLHPVVVWVGAHVFHLSITVFSNGSGDTTYDYVRVATTAVLAAAVALPWALGSRGAEDARLAEITRVGLRYSLAFLMFVYGGDKLFKLQFPDLSYANTLEPLGTLTPMDLLWHFMGFSAPYTIFGGVAELLGGALLLFRRTTTLGALVVAVVMSNVVMLNLCYDVPVKILSSHLLVIAIVLAARDAQRLADVFLFNRVAAPADLTPVFEPRYAGLAIAAKGIFVAGTLYVTLWTMGVAFRERHAPITPPRGTYEVTSFVEDGKDGVDLPGAPRHVWRLFRWKGEYARVWHADLHSDVYEIAGDPLSGAPVKLLPADEAGKVAPDTAPAGELSLRFSPDGAATVEGKFLGHDLAIAMTRREAGDSPLLRRGFHWVTEAPYEH